MAKSTCSVRDCEEVARTRGWCRLHYERWRATGDPEGKRRPGRPPTNEACTVNGCGNPAKVRSLCPAHYRRQRLGRDQSAPLRRYLPGARCTVIGCDRDHFANGLCTMHEQRRRRRDHPGAAEPQQAPSGTGYIKPDGYRVFRRNGRNVLEHREVMEAALGRRLYPFETVHHRNGRRADNRLENLELWTSPQPYGQRPEDLVSWIVKFYPELTEAELRARKHEQKTGQLRLVD